MEGKTLTSRHREPRGVADVAESARELASLVDVRAIATRVTDDIIGEVWSDRNRASFYAALDRSVYANIEAIFATLQHRRAIDAPPPVPALDFAMTSAEMAIPAIELERAYRIGLGSLWSQWLDLASDFAAESAYPLEDLLRGPSLAFLNYIDLAGVAVVERADTVRVELRRTQSQLRQVLLLQILEESATEPEPELDRRLGYRTGDAHLALLAHAPDLATLQREIWELERAVDARGTLVLQISPQSWCVWLGRPGGFEAGQLNALRRALGRGPLTVAISEPAVGLPGLRQAYEQALETSRLQQALGPRTHRVLWEADVRLESLLLRDTRRARQFVDAELGQLAEDDGVAEKLRETLLAWLATGSHVSAAAMLGVHDNTVRNRLKQAESMLGVAVHQRRVELQVGLRLARVLQAREASSPES